MPALNIPDIERFTLGNGLSVVLCHAPWLKRCAASLRVAAGSHDVPVKWPGLAHFLEHLFFLGTERFGADQNLMRFVQRHGGQINASTRERTTDFFFELPTAVFADGVQRLCDMLAHPRMAFAEQLREREVLHAEFIAWSRDTETRRHAALLAQVNPQHPLRGFHAGNRYSLAVPNPAFQQALKDFYKRYYQAGQITLCLSGPQPLAELRALATRYGAEFATGDHQAQTPSPPLARIEPNPVAQQDPQGVHLLFACEGLPAASEQAAAFLCHWLNTSKPRSLAAVLRDLSLIDSLRAIPLYQFGGQFLLDIEFCGADPEKRATLAQLFFSWMAFFKTQWPALVEEYDSVQQRRLQTCSAMDLAHHYCRDLPEYLGEQGSAALDALFLQLTHESLLHRPAMNSDAIQVIEWQLPPPNPFLLPETAMPSSIAPAKTVVYARLLEHSNESAIYLRWQLQSAQPRLWQMLNQRLKVVVDDAKEAGVLLTFSAYGVYWQLRLIGFQQPMPSVIKHVLDTLTQALTPNAAGFNEPPLIPIRQLLKVLPDRFIAAPIQPAIDDLLAIWSGARWQAYAVGVPPEDEAAVSAASGLAPGVPLTELVSLKQLPPGKQWSMDAAQSSEDAVLVFCPAAGTSIADEATWRMLGHLLQGPFYQRLRVELQLGYAVFSGVRQIDGRTGLLFGVQSPACSAADLLGHIEAFLEKLPALIEASDVAQQQVALAAQFEPAHLPNEQLAELLWQAHLAGHEADYLQRLQHALADLNPSTLLEAAHRLASAKAGWLILSNKPGSLPER